jgi:type II secretory pathway predicted ATPase ExeA
MYEASYGLREKPFSLTPDPAYFYRSPSHANGLDLFRHALDRRHGVVVVTGTSGTGKTTLCRTILNEIDRNMFTALVLNPHVSPDDLVRLVLQDFGVLSREEAWRGQTSELGSGELLRTLHDFLRSLVPIGARALLLVDEAQRLPRLVLEQVQRLAGLAERGRPLLQIGLVGQLNLHDNLRAPELKALVSSISIRYRLRPLTSDETASYVSHRMKVAGDESASRFSPKALQRIHRATGGNPRLINVLSDRALVAAYSGRLPRVEDEMVVRAAYGLGLEPKGVSVLGWLRRVAAL